MRLRTIIFMTAAGLCLTGLFAAERLLTDDRLKARIEESTSKFLGCRLTIEQLQRARFPGLELIGKNVRLYEDENRLLIDCPEMRVDVSLLSMLWLRLGISEVRFINPRIQLRYGKGWSNIGTIVQHIRSRPKTKSKNILQLSFDRFVVSNGTVEIENRDTGKSPLEKPVVADAVGRIAGGLGTKKFPFQLTLHPKGAERPNVKLKGVVGAKPTFAGVIQSSASTVNVDVKFPRKRVVDLTIKSPKADILELAAWGRTASRFSVKSATPAATVETGAAQAKAGGPGWEVQGTVAIATAVLVTEPLHNLTFNLERSTGGAFDVKNIQSRAFGGAMTGVVNLSTSGVAILASGHEWDVERFLHIFRSTAGITGTAQMELAIVSTMGQGFLRGARGVIDVTVINGRLPKAPAILKTLTAANLHSLEKAIEGGESLEGLEIKKGVARMYIGGGKAEAKDKNPWVVENRLLQLGYIGNIDFVNRSLDGSIVVHALNVADEIFDAVPGVRDVLLGGEKSFLPIWVRVKGPVNDPKVRAMPAKSVAAPLWNTVGNILRLPKTIIDKATSK